MRRVTTAIAVAVAAVLGLVLLTGDEDVYRLKLPLQNAEGLRAGSAVVVGGARIGKVEELRLEGDDQVVADLEIKTADAPVGRDVRTTIAATNLLGQKVVQLSLGDVRDPAPSGFEIPADRVTPSTDLSQVLNTLDADTRARLTVFIKEAGDALTDRKEDFNRFLEVLPGGMADLTQFLNDLAGDNRSLGDLVDRSNAFVASLEQRKDDAVRLVRAVAESSDVVASRRNELLATLHEAPGALTQLRSFLTRLEAATVPIRPAAQALIAAAPPLTTTLEELAPFQAAAAPALDRVTAIAPSLTRLATGATPILERARRPVSTLRRFSTQAVPPTGRILDNSVDNIVAIAAQWGGNAINARDGLAHIFRGEVALTAEAIRTAISRIELLDGLNPDQGKRRRGGSTRRPPSAIPDPPSSTPLATGRPLKPVVDEVLSLLPQLRLPELKRPLEQVLQPGGPPANTEAVTGLLDYLLKP